MSLVKIDSLSAKQLRTVLQSRNRSTAGTKAELIVRLIEEQGSDEISSDEVAIEPVSRSEFEKLREEISAISTALKSFMERNTQTISDGSFDVAKSQPSISLPSTSSTTIIAAATDVPPLPNCNACTRANVTPILPDSMTHPHVNTAATLPSTDAGRVHPNTGDAIVNAFPPNATGVALSRTHTTHSQIGGRMLTIREVCETLPAFDPSSELSLTSTQFVNRVEMLQVTFGWEDGLVLLAVSANLRGPAKLWFDSHPQPHVTWQSLAVDLVRNFPNDIDESVVHAKLLSTERRSGETIESFYHRMCAIARRGNVNERATVKYIQTNLRHPTLQNSIASFDFATTTELLAAIRRFFANASSRAGETRDRASVTRTPQASRSSTNTGMQQEKVGQSTLRLNDSRANRRGEIVCYNCWGTGHISINCTQPQRRERCATCSRTTHTTEQCVEKRRQPPGNIRRITTQASEAAAACYKDVDINGHKMKVFVDPGSDRSLIRSSVADALFNVRKGEIVTLKGFAGGVFESRHRAEATIDVDGHRQIVEFVTVDDALIPAPALLGCDVLCAKDNRLVMESGQCRLEKIDSAKICVGTELIKDEQKALYELIEEFSRCFSEEIGELGRCRDIEMIIEVNPNVKVEHKPYRIPFAKRGIVEKITSDLLQHDIIRPSQSEYSSPIVLVKKSNGEDRLCVDYRSLNAITTKQPYPMPSVDEQLSLISGNKYFTTLDLMAGYYQIPVKESSKRYTAFITHEGLFEFNVMPFGLVNAPAVFQKMITRLTRKMKPGEAVPYVDEVIIPSQTIAEGLERLRKFLVLTEESGLTVRLSKCVFLATESSFLGHRIMGDLIKPGVQKTAAIEQFPRPNCVTEVRRFIGLTGFFRKFVKDYALIARPLTALLKTKGNPSFDWKEEHENAFQHLKRLLCSEPVLAMYDQTKNHELHTDASSIGLAAVLLQQTETRQWKPTFYFSRLCTESEKNFHSYELEVLAIVEAVERFRLYLLGKHFRIITDCSAVSNMKNSKPMVPRVARWFLKLQEYDFELVHRPGNTMTHVDALSRAPVGKPKEATVVADNIMIIAAATEDWIAAMQYQDPELRKIVNIIRNDQQSPQQKQLRMEYKIKGHRLYRIVDGKEKFVVPKSIRWRIVNLYHDKMGHFGVEKTIQRIVEHFWFARMRNYVKSYINSCIECCYNKNVTGRPEGQLHIYEAEPIPFRVLHLDHLGPFPRSTKGNLYIIAASDPFSKYLILKAVRTTKSKPVIEMLNELTVYFGLPKRLITDRGTAFTSREFETYCHDNQIEHIKTAVRTPRANGQVERANQNILSFLRTSTTDRHKWDQLLRNMQWSLNSMENSTTGFSPNEIVFDFPLRDVIHNSLLLALTEENHNDATQTMTTTEKREDAARKILAERNRWKTRFDERHRKPRSYETGDLVLIENALASTGESRKLEPRYRGPYRIKKVLRFDRYVVESLPNQDHLHRGREFTSVYSSDKLKPWCHLHPELDELDLDENELGPSSNQEGPSCQHESSYVEHDVEAVVRHPPPRPDASYR